MKNYLLLLTFFLLISTTFAQSYVPFPEGEAIWHVGYKQPDYGVGIRHDQYAYAGDTMLNGITYNKVLHATEWIGPGATVSDLGIIGYIRQDSIARKVYYLPKTEMQESLLYDFSLQPGDTCPLTYGHNSFPQLILIAKDSVMTGTGYRSEFILLSPIGGVFDTVKIVEGIGSLSGPFTEYGSVCFEYCEWLSCFQQDGETIFSSDMSNFYPLGLCNMVGIDNPGTSSNNYQLYPNLVTLGLEVSLTNNLSKKLYVSIYDVHGSLIWNGNANPLSDFKIQTEGFQKGIYLVSMYSEGEALKNVKLIIQ